MKKKLLVLTLSSMLCSPYAAMAMETDVEFHSTGNAAKFIQHSDKLEIETDNNANASYQAESKRYAVIPGQIVKVDYSIDVTQGIMSLGALNTNRNGWYFNEKRDVEEIVRPVGSHKGTIEWVVPANETVTSLVLRNYHLGTPGESHFTVHKMTMRMKGAGEILDEELDKLTIQAHQITQQTAEKVVEKFEQSTQRNKQLRSDREGIIARRSDLMRQLEEELSSGCSDKGLDKSKIESLIQQIKDTKKELEQLKTSLAESSLCFTAEMQELGESIVQADNEVKQQIALVGQKQKIRHEAELEHIKNQINGL